MPSGPIPGPIEIAATFCYACETDPEHPFAYTRAGLDVTFRPNSRKFGRPSKNGVPPLNPLAESFFKSQDNGLTEQELRDDAHKWEPVLRASRVFRDPAHLHEPVFDIHYNARLAGAPTRTALPIPYALIVTVRASATTDLYERVYSRYRNLLQELRPVIEIPIRF